MVDFSLLLNFFLHIKSCGSKNWQSSHGNDVNMTSSRKGAVENTVGMTVDEMV